MQKEEHKLQNLKEKIICSSRLNTRLGLLEQQFDRKSIPIVDQLSLEIKPSQNIYAFHSTAQWRDHDGKGDEFLLPPSILHPSA